MGVWLTSRQNETSTVTRTVLPSSVQFCGFRIAGRVDGFHEQVCRAVGVVNHRVDRVHELHTQHMAKSLGYGYTLCPLRLWLWVHRWWRCGARPQGKRIFSKVVGALQMGQTRSPRGGPCSRLPRSQRSTHAG